MLFNIQGPAQLQSLNITRGTSEDPNSNATIKLEAQSVPSESVAAAIGEHDVRALKSAFFKLDDEKTPNFPGFGWMATGGKWEDRHFLQIDDDETKHRVAMVRGVKVRPSNGHLWDVMFTLRIEDPSGDLLEHLSNSLHESISIDLQHDAELELAHNQEEHEASQQSEAADQSQFEELAA